MQTRTFHVNVPQRLHLAYLPNLTNNLKSSLYKEIKFHMFKFYPLLHGITIAWSLSTIIVNLQWLLYFTALQALLPGFPIQYHIAFH